MLLVSKPGEATEIIITSNSMEMANPVWLDHQEGHNPHIAD